ncbi:MAG: hypothetical protein IPK76_23230 [Lewinellaceae bacterium]|nr:hypothetical protein [Lewinellaceae bacterium]
MERVVGFLPFDVSFDPRRQCVEITVKDRLVLSVLESHFPALAPNSMIFSADEMPRPTGTFRDKSAT